MTRAWDLVDARLEEATQLANDKRFDDAVSLIERLREKHPSNPRVLGVLGATLYRANRLLEARPLLEHAVAAAPHKELPSLVLFHCLWDLGLVGEARDELVRYLAGADSEAHEEILAEFGWEFDRESGVLTTGQRERPG